MASLPSSIEVRLIDMRTLYLEASIAGLTERYGRGNTSHTIHVWWARRPHTAMRSLAFAALCKERSGRSLGLMEVLNRSPRVPTNILEQAQTLLMEQYKSPPRTLDMFGGGGTIPLEFASLGAESFAVDANELSVFIQECNLVYSQAVRGKDVAHLLMSSGNRVLAQLEEETATLFPLRKTGTDLLIANGSSPIAYLWTYSMICQECEYKFYLSKRPWLSKKHGRKLALKLLSEEKGQVLCIDQVPDNYRHPSNWIGKSGKVRCPNCGTEYGNISITQLDEELVAMVRTGQNAGKEFVPTEPDALPSVKHIMDMEQVVLTALDAELPSSKLPKWSGIVNPALYGIQTHTDSLNLRQRVVLLMLIKSLTDEYERLRVEESEAIAKYVIGLLSALVDQCVDWNCRLSMWIAQNEQVGRAFCGPGVAMLWDFVEIDPILSGPANLRGKLKRIVAGAESIGRFSHVPSIQHALAQELPFDDEYFDAIITDPPYYDNIYYTVLADFFYVWKRLLLRKIEPELFHHELTSSSRELVASTFRNGSPEKAHETYCKELSLAISEAARVLHPKGVFGLVYSHSSLRGWEALVQAFRSTNLIITSVQPLSIERKQRPRAMTSEAINTCITFVTHKSEEKKSHVDIGTICERIREICRGFAIDLLSTGWHAKDVALAVYAHGVAMLANAQTVSGCNSDIDALLTLETVVKEEFPEFQIKDRNPL